MSITADFKTMCSNYGVEPQLVALMLYIDYELQERATPLLKLLLAKGLIVMPFNSMQPFLTDKGYEMLGNIKEDNSSLAERLIAIYPDGIKPNTNKKWSASKSTIAARLSVFKRHFGDYTDEQIIEATKRYMETFNGDFTLMRILMNFIFLGDPKDGYSDLRDEIENPITKQTNDNEFLR